MCVCVCVCVCIPHTECTLLNTDIIVKWGVVLRERVTTYLARKIGRATIKNKPLHFHVASHVERLLLVSDNKLMII